LLPKKKGEKYLDSGLLKRSIDFFLPHLARDAYINFTGGEPLLAFHLIKIAVAQIQEKHPFRKKYVRFALTTNGSLLDQDTLDFLSEHRFSVSLSYDGTAQDLNRGDESSHSVKLALKALTSDPRIHLQTNSVFTSETVHHLAGSAIHLVRLNVPEIIISFAQEPAWDRSSLDQLQNELTRLRAFLVSHYLDTEEVPILNFKKPTESGVFSCSGGINRMAVDAAGSVWGCYLFPDFCNISDSSDCHDSYCFGDLDAFIGNYAEKMGEILPNLEDISLKRAYTPEGPCSDCSELTECRICPVSAALSGHNLGHIPTWTCQLNKLLRQERHKFWEELGGG
jgi:sulfatase maturation enzyme AslB (radical SAM superfamily)